MPVETRGSNNLRRRPVGSYDQNPSKLTRAMEFAKWTAASTWHMYVQRDCTMSKQQLQRLGDHKYSAQDISWLDNLCMKQFWDQVVQLYPMWLAPNLITMVGLVINIATVVILSFFSLDAKQSAPSWAYLLAALGLFCYQTLDATDGKQARRTNSASPLGELFDHGCDSLAQVFVSLNVCLSMQLGDMRFVVLFICVFAVIMFYCAHWSTYCTGTLRFARSEANTMWYNRIAFDNVLLIHLSSSLSICINRKMNAVIILALCVAAVIAQTTKPTTTAPPVTSSDIVWACPTNVLSAAQCAKWSSCMSTFNQAMKAGKSASTEAPKLAAVAAAAVENLKTCAGITADQVSKILAPPTTTTARPAAQQG